MNNKHLKLDSISETFVNDIDNSLKLTSFYPSNIEATGRLKQLQQQKELLFQQYIGTNQYSRSLHTFLLSNDVTLNEYEDLLDELSNYFNFDEENKSETSLKLQCIYPPQSKFSSNIIFLDKPAGARSSKGKGGQDAFMEILKNSYNNQTYTQEFESRLWKCHLILNANWNNDIHTFQFLQELDYLHFVYAIQYMNCLAKNDNKKGDIKEWECAYKQGVCQYLANVSGGNNNNNNSNKQSAAPDGESQKHGLFHRLLHHPNTNSSESKKHFTNSDTYEIHDNVLTVSYRSNNNNNTGTASYIAHLEISLTDIYAIALHSDYSIPMSHVMSLQLTAPAQQHNHMVVKLLPANTNTNTNITSFATREETSSRVHANAVTGELEYHNAYVLSSVALPGQHEAIINDVNKLNKDDDTTEDNAFQHSVTLVPLASNEWHSLLLDGNSSISTSDNNNQWKVDIFSLPPSLPNSLVSTSCDNLISATTTSQNNVNPVHYIVSKSLNKTLFVQDICIPKLVSLGQQQPGSPPLKSVNRENLHREGSGLWKNNKWISPKRSNTSDNDFTGSTQSGKLARTLTPPRGTFSNDNINTNTGGGGESYDEQAKKALAYGRVIPVDMIFSTVPQAQQPQQLFRKALRIVLQRASDLTIPNTSKSYVPSVYCTAYLVGKNNERLTMNQAEVRTEGIKSLNPSWDHEILLQDASSSSIENVFAVMILLRDASSGILKHKHIGQVTIPIDCFLADIEASLSLPLEPSYRMDSRITEKAFIGEIHVITQLVDVELPGNSNGMGLKNKTVALRKRLSTRSPSMELANASLHCVLFRTSPLTTWWPMRVLSSTTASTTTNSLAQQASSRSLYARVYDGFLLCSPKAFLIKLDPNLLATFGATTGNIGIKRYSLASSANTQGGGGSNATILQDSLELSEGLLHIPWQQVGNAFAVSPGGLLVSLTIHIHTSIGGNNPDSMKYVPAGIEIIVGPCPAYELREKILFRKKYESMMRALFDLHKEQQLASLTNDGKSGGKATSSTTMKGSTSHSQHPPSPSSTLSNDVISRKLRTLSIAELVTRTHFIVNTLVDYYHEAQHTLTASQDHLSIGQNASHVSAIIALPVHNQRHALWESIWIQLLYQFFQSCVLKKFFLSPHYAYYLQQADEIPEYSNANNLLTEMIENDVYESSILLPIQDNQPASSNNNSNGSDVDLVTLGNTAKSHQNFMKRFEAYLESSLNTIMDYLMFFHKVTAKEHAAVGNRGSGKESDIYGATLPDVVKSCVETLVLGYFQGLQKALSSYIASKAVFLSPTISHELRHAILQFVGYYQSFYPMVIHRTLVMTCGLTYTSKHALTLCEHTPKLMKWYLLALLKDTRTTLVKDINESAMHQLDVRSGTNNNSGLHFPWLENYLSQCMYMIEHFMLHIPIFSEQFLNAHNNTNNSSSAKAQPPLNSKENLLNILAIKSNTYRAQFITSRSLSQGDEDELLAMKLNPFSQKSYKYEKSRRDKRFPRMRRWLLTLFGDLEQSSSDQSFTDETIVNIAGLNEQLFLGMLSFWSTIVFEQLNKYFYFALSEKLRCIQQMVNSIGVSISSSNGAVVLESQSLNEQFVSSLYMLDQIVYDFWPAVSIQAMEFIPAFLTNSAINSIFLKLHNQYSFLFDAVIQQISTLIFTPLQNDLIHFDTMWCVEGSSSHSLRLTMQIISTAVHDFEGLLNFHRPSSPNGDDKLRQGAEETISAESRQKGYLISVIYSCSEIVVLRYLTLFRDKLVVFSILNSANGANNNNSDVNTNNASTNAIISEEEKKQLANDLEYLQEQFAMLLISVGYEDKAVKNRAEEESKRANDLNDWFLNPRLDYFSNRWICNPAKNSFSKTKSAGMSDPVPTLLSPLDWLRIFYSLVFEDHRSVPFNTSLSTFLQYYRFNDYVDHGMRGGDAQPFVDEFLLHVIVPLRCGLSNSAGASTATESEVSTYLQEILSSYHFQNSSYNYTSMNISGLAKKDVLYRIFGDDVVSVGTATNTNPNKATTFFPKPNVHISTTAAPGKSSHSNLVNMASSAMKSLRSTTNTLMQNVLSSGGNNANAYPYFLLKNNRNSEEYSNYIFSTIGLALGNNSPPPVIGVTSLPSTPLSVTSSVASPNPSTTSSSPFSHLGIKELLLAGIANTSAVSATGNPNFASTVCQPSQSTSPWVWDSSDDEDEDSCITSAGNNPNNASIVSEPGMLKRKESFKLSMKAMFTVNERKNSSNNVLFSPTASTNNGITAGRTMSNSSTSSFANSFANLVRTPSNSQHVVSMLSGGVSLYIHKVAIKGLHSSALLSKANPYIAFTIATQRVKTSTKFNTNETTWFDEPALVLGFPSVDLLYQQTLRVEVFDKEVIRRKHMLGYLELPLSPQIVSQGYGGDDGNAHSWYILHFPSDEAPHDTTIAGEVTFSLAVQ